MKRSLALVVVTVLGAGCCTPFGSAFAGRVDHGSRAAPTRQTAQAQHFAHAGPTQGFGRGAMPAQMHFPAAAIAGGRREGDFRFHADPRTRGGDFRFHADMRQWGPREHALWRGGHWRQELHGGRYGWWWDVNGVWYFYDHPVYPYPAIVSEVIAEEPVPSFAPVAAAPVAIPLGPPPPQFWYYCDSPAGYYPYVATCGTAFRQVPVTSR